MKDDNLVTNPTWKVWPIGMTHIMTYATVYQQIRIAALLYTNCFSKLPTNTISRNYKITNKRFSCVKELVQNVSL